jgi:hypothetical protein
MAFYPDLITAQTDINTGIGSQTSSRAITPTIHSNVLNNTVETIFRYSTNTGEDTFRTTLSDADFNFIQVPEVTYTGSQGAFKVERATTSGEWKTIMAQGNATVAKTGYNSEASFDLQNASGIGSRGNIWIQGLIFDGQATTDPDHFDGSSSAILLGSNTGNERVDDVRLFFNDFRDQSNSAVENKVGGDNYEFFFNRASNIGGECYSVAGSQWGMYCFNRLVAGGSHGLALNSGSAWNVVIGNIVQSGSSDFTNNADAAFKTNGYGNIVLGNISWNSRGHIAAHNNTGYTTNGNQTWASEHSIYAFNRGHGLGAPDETTSLVQQGYEVQGNLNLFFGNLNNSVQAIDKVGESLGDSIGTCHDTMKITECGRLDFENEIFEGGRIQLETTKARHIRFKDCKFFMWGHQDSGNWHDTHIFRCTENNGAYRLDFIDCEFDNACGCLIKMESGSKINQVNIVNGEEFLWNNIAELAGDEDSTTTIVSGTSPSTLSIGRVASYWKGFKAAWPSGQEFYLCTISGGDILYQTVTGDEKAYPNMGSSSSFSFSVQPFVATNNYRQKDSWLALKKRSGIDTNRGLVYLENDAEIDSINIIDRTYLGTSYSLSGYEISAGNGIVQNATLNGSGVDPSGIISGVPSYGF